MICNHKFLKLKDKTRTIAGGGGFEDGIVVICPHCGQVRNVWPDSVEKVTEGTINLELE